MVTFLLCVLIWTLLCACALLVSLPPHKNAHSLWATWPYLTLMTSLGPVPKYSHTVGFKLQHMKLPVKQFCPGPTKVLDMVYQVLPGLAFACSPVLSVELSHFLCVFLSSSNTRASSLSGTSVHAVSSACNILLPLSPILCLCNASSFPKHQLTCLPQGVSTSPDVVMIRVPTSVFSLLFLSSTPPMGLKSLTA